MLTVLEVVKRSTEFLEQRGVASPRLNAELILGHALALPRMQLYLQFERPLAEPELARIRELVRERGRRRPLQYVLGWADFAGLRLKVDPRALIPRPETEGLVELVAAAVRAEPARVLDLGTGSGAIALALAKRWPGAAIVATDLSPAALELAGENAAALGLAAQVRFRSSRWFSDIPADERFEVIVSNPPYLTEDEVGAAETEVKDHEPRDALVGGGPAGSLALEEIIAGAAPFLAPDGILALETGTEQHARLADAARAAGFREVTSHRDLTGRDRYVLARKS